MSLFSSYRCGRRVSAIFLPVLLLAACAAEEGSGPQPSVDPPPAQLLSLEGRYSGPVMPLFPNCGMPNTGALSIGRRGGRMSFALDPFQSTTVIRGEVAADGTLRGTLTYMSGQAIQFEGRARQEDGRDSIVGTLNSGQCRWRATLRRG